MLHRTNNTIPDKQKVFSQMAESKEELLRQKARKIMDTFSDEVTQMYLYGTPDDRTEIIKTYLLPDLEQDIIEQLNDEYTKRIQENKNDEKSNILAWHLGNILRLGTKNDRFLAWFVTLENGELESVFQNQNNKDKFFQDIDTYTPNEIEKLSEILPGNDGSTVIVKRYKDPPKIIKITSNKQSQVDLSEVIVIGDVDASGYKFPKPNDETRTIFNTLPMAIIGKFDCSGWDKKLFALIDKLPFAETIDCSFSINSLDDLIGKLPDGLQTLVVQETLIKPNALQNDQEKLQSAQKFMETYPNLTIVDAKGKYNLADTVNQLTTSTKKDEQKPVAKKVVQKPQPTQPVKKQEKTYTIDEVIAMFPETDPEKLHQWIEQEIKDKHKQTDESTGQTLLTQKAVNRITDLVAKDVETQSQQKKTSAKKQQENIESVTDDKTQKSQNIIKIYIKQSDLDKDENLYSILGNFNVWPQPNHISKKSNNTCCYINAENKEKLLNGMKFKTTSSLSYGIYASRHDFKITKLTDIDENGEIKPVLDEFGKEIFVMVCVKYFKSHEKNSKDNREHKRIINGLDIIVTPKPLTKSQQNKFNCLHQNSNNDIKFFALSNLDDSYMQFTYTPYETTEPTNTDVKPQPAPTPETEKPEKTEEKVDDKKPVVADKPIPAPQKIVKKTSPAPKPKQEKEAKVTQITPQKPLEPKHIATTKTLLDWAKYFNVMPSFMMLVFKQLIHNSFSGDKSIAQTIEYKHHPSTIDDTEKFTVSNIDTLSAFIKSKRNNFLTEKQVVMFNNYRFKAQELIAQCKKLSQTYSETSIQSYFYHIDMLPEEMHDNRTYYFVKKNLPQFIDAFFPDPRAKAKCDLWSTTSVAAKLGLDYDKFMQYIDTLPLDFKNKWFVGNESSTNPDKKFKSIFFDDLKALLIKTTDYRPVILNAIEETQLTELKSLLDLTSLEKIVNELSTMLQDANRKLIDTKQEHATISSEIAEKTANGSFNLLQALYAKAQSATTDVITAQQNVESVSARFNKAKSLLDQRNIALAEKEAAEKVLKTKQEILQNTDNEIKKFLQESINTNQR